MKYKHIKSLAGFWIIIFSCSKTFAQNIKYYSGDFEHGSAKFSYYEDQQFNRVYSGEFNYDSRYFFVSGNFKEGKRNGIWKISNKNKIYGEFGIGKVMDNTIVSGNYIYGKFDGKWTYYQNKKIIEKDSYQFGEELTTTSEANFKNNLFVGEFDYTKKGNKSSTSVHGYFNEQSRPHGEWVTTNSNTTKTEIFMNGILAYQLVRRLPSLEKISFLDRKNQIETLWKNYDSKTQISVIGDTVYLLKSSENSNLIEGSSIWYYDEPERYSDIIWNPIYHFKLGCEVPKYSILNFEKCVIEDYNSSVCNLKYKEYLVNQFIQKAEDFESNNQLELALTNIENARNLDVKKNTERNIQIDEYYVHKDRLNKTIDTIYDRINKKYISQKYAENRKEFLKKAQDFIQSEEYEKALILLDKARKIESNEELEEQILLVKQKNFETKGDSAFALMSYQEALKWYQETRTIKQTSDLEIKIKKTELAITNAKRALLIEKAESNYRKGKLIETIESYKEANMLIAGDDLNNRIQHIENELKLAVVTRSECKEVLNECSSHRNIKINQSTIVNLNKIKEGYGLTYKNCINLLNQQLDMNWIEIQQLWAQNKDFESRDNWNEQDKNILVEMKAMLSKITESKQFETKISNAILVEDRKFLKPLKGDDLQNIINEILAR